MKTLQLTSPAPALAKLLRMARRDVLMVTTGQGEKFVISVADEFATEVQLLRRNRRFLAVLDALKKDEGRIPLREAEKKLR